MVSDAAAASSEAGEPVGKVVAMLPATEPAHTHFAPANPGYAQIAGVYPRWQLVPRLGITCRDGTSGASATWLRPCIAALSLIKHGGPLHFLLA